MKGSKYPQEPSRKFWLQQNQRQILYEFEETKVFIF